MSKLTKIKLVCNIRKGTREEGKEKVAGTKPKVKPKATPKKKGRPKK